MNLEPLKKIFKYPVKLDVMNVNTLKKVLVMATSSFCKIQKGKSFLMMNAVFFYNYYRHCKVKRMAWNPVICCWFTPSWDWQCRPAPWSSVSSFFGLALNASFPCSIYVKPLSTALVRVWWMMMHFLSVILGMWTILLLLFYKGISLLALATVNGYHGYVLFAWLYGFCLGGYHYALHQYTLDRVRARQFARGWSLVLAIRALPTLFGVPIAGR